MGRRIDPSWGGGGGGDPLSYFSSIQCSTTGVAKAVVCDVLSMGWCM